MQEYVNKLFSYLLTENPDGADLHNRENFMKYIGRHLFDLYDFYESLDSEFYSKISEVSATELLELLNKLNSDNDTFFEYLKTFLDKLGVTLYDSYKDMIKDIQQIAAFFAKTKFTLLGIIATVSSNTFYVVGNHVPEYNYWLFINKFNLM